MENLLNRLIEKQNLTAQETQHLFSSMVDGSIVPTQIAAILTALRMKGESVDEMIGFITAMRERMIKVDARDAIDVCGTGGDGKGTFNISTTVAFVVAGAGVTIAKHGNRAASSACGSADVLEQLGVKIDLQPRQAERLLQDIGIAFLFAPLYHPAMKQLGAVRKELKTRTVFNFLGPLVNPASVKRQIVGVPNVTIAQTLAEVATHFDYDRLLIISSEDGLDELSTQALNTILEIRGTTVSTSMLDPREYNFRKTSRASLAGGSADKNARILKDILSGKKRAEKRHCGT